MGVLSASTALATPLPFQHFLKEYQLKSPKIITAQQQISQAKFQRERQTDDWQSKLNISPELNFETRILDTVPVIKTPNRSQRIGASYTQSMPTGTSLEIKGQEFVEKSNPLLSSLDSTYSAKITQDLARNSLGRTQRSKRRKAATDFKVALMEYRQAEVNSCEDAFNLYADTYVQQEKWNVLSQQMKDALKAQRIAKQLYQDRLIHKVDLLSSESDYLSTKVQVDQAEQLLLNNKRQMSAYYPEETPSQMQLINPSNFLGSIPANNSGPTYNEKIVSEKLKSQEFEVDRARSDRWTDVQLGLEAGQRKGRLSSSGTLTPFTEDYLYASLNISFDIINKTETGALKNAIDIKNSLAIQNNILSKTQESLVKNLRETHRLLNQQVKTSEAQVKMLNEKANIAFQQMKRGKMDFQNYLIHRNAYRNQQINFLNLKKDLWLNHFSLKKAFINEKSHFCGSPS